MGKQVPFVIYNRGNRTVLGMASVSDSGEIVAQVSKDMWPTVKHLFAPSSSEFALAPAKPAVPKTNYNVLHE